MHSKGHRSSQNNLKNFEKCKQFSNMKKFKKWCKKNARTYQATSTKNIVIKILKGPMLKKANGTALLGIAWTKKPGNEARVQHFNLETIRKQFLNK